VRSLRLYPAKQLILWPTLALACVLTGCSDDDGAVDMGVSDTGVVDAGGDGPAADSAASCPPYTPLKEDISTDTTLSGCYIVEDDWVLGARYIRVFSFYPPEGGTITEFRDEVFTRIDGWVKEIETRHPSLVLVHENDVMKALIESL